jgi:hypothetical protein
MSTKIEELSDIEEDDEQVQCEYTENEIEQFDDTDQVPSGPDEPENINYRIIKMLLEKLKHPVLVTIIMLLLTHPLLIQGIFRIPYVEVIDNTISVNVILSILGGILFFLLREIV